MIFSKNLYWGRHAGKRKQYILENLRKRHFQPGAYVIIEAKSPNLYEIYNQAMFLNPRLDTDDVEVLGIGYGYKDAVECVTRMILSRSDLQP
ncbi:hypothetical protein [Oribacterium sp. WCC10]|uniref:hypothetical protein n=1 Tax=Oribacterium sp. WCC10 TaxID=1855343 RepID=UPI0008F20932|nr:hypothetical protein [Oribacterium sp. WCC10]SFG41923.1 hypothetical protein SAMN05216356_10830 [Oribacterium sp. WCC10]